jgi:hypothetical protein
MFPILKAALLLAIVGLPSGPASAQVLPAMSGTATAAVARPDPTDPKAPVPATMYRSSLANLPAFAETPLAPWRETNEAVRQRGGWRAYARESAAPEAVPASAPAAASPARSAASVPAATGHSGHPVK